MKTCLNCGRQLTNEGYYGCCSMSCSKAWELKKVNTAANIAQAGLLAEQNKMLEQQIRQQKAAEAAEHAKNRAEALQKMYEVGFKSEEEFNSFLKDHPEALSMTMEESGKYKEEIKAKEKREWQAKIERNHQAYQIKVDFTKDLLSRLTEKDKPIQKELGKIDRKYSKDKSIGNAQFPVVLTIIGIFLKIKFHIFPFLNFFLNAILFLAIGLTLVFIKEHIKISSFVKNLKKTKRKSDNPNFLISPTCFSMEGQAYNFATFGFKLALSLFITILLPFILNKIIGKSYSILCWIVEIIVIIVIIVKFEESDSTNLCKFYVKKNLFSELGPFFECSSNPHGTAEYYAEYCKVQKYGIIIDEKKHNDLLKEIAILEKLLNEKNFGDYRSSELITRKIEPDNSTQEDVEKIIRLAFNYRNQEWIFEMTESLALQCDEIEYDEIKALNSLTEKYMNKTLALVEKYSISKEKTRQSLINDVRISYEKFKSKHFDLWQKIKHKHL